MWLPKGSVPAPIALHLSHGVGFVQGFPFMPADGANDFMSLLWQVGPRQMVCSRGNELRAVWWLNNTGARYGKNSIARYIPVICLCREETIALGRIFYESEHHLIDKRVILDCERMTLSRAGESITISESERSLFIAFHEGLFKKDDLIQSCLGAQRCVVVLDASYYKID